MYHVCLAILLFATCVAAAPEREAIAVLELDGTDFTESERQTLTDRLRLELAMTGRFRVLERERMSSILKEQGFSNAGCTSTECAVEVGRLLNVRTIVAGRVGRIGSVHSLSLRMIDVESGEIGKTAVKDCRCALEDVLMSVIRETVGELVGNVARVEPVAVAPPPKPVVKPKAVKPVRRKKPSERKWRWTVAPELGFPVGRMADRVEGIGFGGSVRVTRDVTPRLTVGMHTGFHVYNHDYYNYRHHLALNPIEAVVLYKLDKKGAPGMYVGAEIGVNYYDYYYHNGFAFSFAPLVGYGHTFNNGFLLSGDVRYQYAGKFMEAHNQYIGVRLGLGYAF
jgi:hypothetical protein